MATITLCIIARNEERFLEGCLASVKGVVSKIVLVDTGSTDRTVAIARAAGALVVSHPWADDFAAARNAALPHATGDWVLVLDADERLAPGAGPALHHAIRHHSFVLGMLPLHDASRLDAAPKDILSGAARRGEPMLLPRLLRRLPDLEWRGRVHENVAEWIERHGLRALHIDAPILHFGAVPELRVERGKVERNLRLLELQCAAEPDTVFAWAYLSSERDRVGNHAGAEEAEELGWQALLRAVARGERPVAIPLAGRRGLRRLGRGDWEGALAVVTEARTIGADHPNLCWVAGSALLRLGRDSVPELERALGWTALTADEIYEGVRGWRTQQLLAEALLSVHPADALRHAEAAFAHAGEPRQALLCVDALLALGRPHEALARVESLLKDDAPDAWSLAAVAARRLGELDLALTFAARVKGGIAAHRAPAFGGLRAELAFRKSTPLAGPGPWGTLGALVRARPLVERPELDTATLTEAVSVLLAREDVPGIEALMSARAEALLPGARAAVLAALDAAGLEWQDDGEDFIFIGGAGRSGTTLFRAMLGAHPRLWCGPERKLIPVYAEAHATWVRSLGPELRASGVDEAALDAAARAWMTSFLYTGVPAGRRVAEKTPHNLLHAAWLGRLFPRARFLHVVRDGRAVAESLVRQGWRNHETGETLAYCANVSNAAAYWAHVVDTSRAQLATVGPRALEVRYEQLVTRPRQVMDEVLAFLSEPWDDAVLHHADAALSGRESSSAAVGQPLHAEAVDAWRTRLSAADVAAIEGAAGGTLTRSGYALTAGGKA